MERVYADSMDLKTGRLYWPQVSRTKLEFDPLEKDIQCDVAIIGAGVTGALAAFYLSQAGLSVAMVDRRQPSEGSTPASTAMLQYEIDTLLTELIDRMGIERAERAYLLSFQSLIDFEELVGQLDDDCAYVQRHSLYLAADASDEKLFHEERKARRKIGIEVNYLDEKEICQRFGISRPAALWSHRAAEIDPHRLTQALHRRSIQSGVRIFGQTQIDKYEWEKAGATLIATNSSHIRAKKVIFAMGYETPEFVDRKICHLKSTYALVSQIFPDEAFWPEKCLIWEHRDPYFYARTTRDGRVMMGGEDIDSADPDKRDRLLPAKCAELVKSFEQLFSQLSIEPEFCWTGTFAETKDGLPYIGSLPEFPNAYFALGYGGNGITFSLLAAKIIRDLVTTGRSKDAELFAFGRK